MIHDLIDRAKMLAAARHFFAERGITEVDVVALTEDVSVDLHIDLFEVVGRSGPIGYLHGSPEQGMKQLLARGMGDCYQLSHVFRDDFVGPNHTREFTMCEWYRLGFSFDEMIEETVQFASLFVQMEGVSRWTYQEALLHYAGVDPFEGDLSAALLNAGIGHDEQLSRADLLQLVVGCIVEPKLPKRRWTVVTHFPKGESALAKVEGECALRFELFGGGLELANGYDELTDPEEQRRRLVEANEERVRIGKPALAVDLESWGRFPECCGVAVGFDRLMKLRSVKR